MNDQEEKAKDVVRTNRVEKEPTDISVKGRMAAFDGTIYFVHWRSKKESREFDTLSYFRTGSDDGVFLWGGEDAIKYLSNLRPVSAIERVARYAFGLTGISAIIALLITLTICYLVIVAKADIPAFLTNALTTILGFFFGSAVGKTRAHID